MYVARRERGQKPRVADKADTHTHRVVGLRILAIPTLACHDVGMHTPTVFLSAATIDLEEWRNILADAFMEAGFRVLTQGRSLGMPPRDVRHMLITRIAESDCIIHLAGQGYGSHASDPFPEQPDFQCSWTQFEYYYAHQLDKPVIAFVCAPELSRVGFVEEGDADERARKTDLQETHRERVKSGKFAGTPLATTVRRTLNRPVDTVKTLLVAVAGCVREVHGLGQAGATVAAQLTLRSGLHQLHKPPQGFVGRVADLDILRPLADKGEAVLTGLRGMGGIGKTALALVLAHEWTPQFPDAQMLLDGRGTHANPPSGCDLLAQVIQTFHPTAKLPDDEAQLKSIYHDLLGGKRVLILLDNARDAAQVAPLIPPAGCALIVTSRHSFMLGKTAPYNVGKLLDAEAVELLREFYPALNDADAAALVKLCAGLPLALRLAGAHLALDAAERGGKANVATYLKDLSSGRLATLDADAPDAGEVTISETLRLSEAQLPEAERTAWRQLGVFTASFDARAAAAIVAFFSEKGRPFAEQKATLSETTLNHFVRRSLLDREGEDRFQLHDLAGEYARSQWGEEALAELYLAHAAHYTAVGNEANALYLNGDAVGGLALFDRERAQIEAAYAGLAGREDEVASRQLAYLVNAVAHTSPLRFYPRQQIVWMKGQLHAARRVQDREMEWPALGNLGSAHANLGDAGQAIVYYEEALAIVREISNRRGEGTVLCNLGSSHFELGDAGQAIGYYEEALAIAREISDRRGEGYALCNLGNAHFKLDHAHQAIVYYRQALGIMREIDDRYGIGNSLCNIGSIYHYMGSARHAILNYEEALIVMREIGDQRNESIALWKSALAYVSLGNRPEAITRATSALAIFEALEDPHAAKVLAKLAEWRSGGDSDRAAD